MGVCITSEAQWPTEDWKSNQSIPQINWQTSAQSHLIRTFSRVYVRRSWDGDPAPRINEEVWDYLCTGTVRLYLSIPWSPELSNIGSLTTGLRICPKWTIVLCICVCRYLHSDMYDIIGYCLTMGCIDHASNEYANMATRRDQRRNSFKAKYYNHFIRKSIIDTNIILSYG